MNGPYILIYQEDNEINEKPIPEKINEGYNAINYVMLDLVADGEEYEDADDDMISKAAGDNICDLGHSSLCIDRFIEENERTLKYKPRSILDPKGNIVWIYKKI